MNNFFKDIILIIIMGIIYMSIEIIWRGYTDPSMGIVGGLCAFLIGRLNEYPSFYNRRMWEECLIGTFIILVLEFTSGMILNIWLGLNIWSYNNMIGNIYGQICIQYSIIWFLLVPLNIFIDDYLRYLLFKEKKPQSLIKNYVDLFTLK